MPIKVKCVKCQADFQVPSDSAGQAGTCPKCYAITPVSASRQSPTEKRVAADNPFAWLVSTVDIIEQGAWIVGGLLAFVAVFVGATQGIPQLFAAALTIAVTALAWLVACHVIRVLLSIDASLRTIAKQRDLS